MKGNIIFMEKIQLQVGDVVKGIVKDTQKIYALISLGNVKAILPSIEYSWHKDFNINNIMKVGEEITAVVINLSRNKVILSIKRLKKNPWKDIDKKYVIGQIVRGKVNKIVDYGAFIELEDGLQGLLHKKEISSTGKVEPSSILSENQEIEVKIISIETNKKRIAFSIKHQV